MPDDEPEEVELFEEIYAGWTATPRSNGWTARPLESPEDRCEG